MESAQMAVVRLTRILDHDRGYQAQVRAAIARQEQERLEQYARIVAVLNERERLDAVERLREAGDVGGVR